MPRPGRISCGLLHVLVMPELEQMRGQLRPVYIFAPTAWGGFRRDNRVSALCAAPDAGLVPGAGADPGGTHRGADRAGVQARHAHLPQVRARTLMLRAKLTCCPSTCCCLAAQQAISARSLTAEISKCLPGQYGISCLPTLVFAPDVDRQAGQQATLTHSAGY